MTYYQWTTGQVEKTSCSPVIGCGYYVHNSNVGESKFKGVYWAWDRSLGAWVHYAK